MIATIDDLAKFFRGTRDKLDFWRPTVVGDGFAAECIAYKVLFTPKSVNYFVTIQASGDPSDRKEEVTVDPVESITDFLGAGFSSDQFFKTSSFIYGIALRISKQITARGVPSQEFAGLLQKLNGKGWKTHTENYQGLPHLVIDIGDGEYKARIRVDEVIWYYEFQVKDKPESLESGESSNPITAFEDYRHQSHIQDLRAEREHEALPGVYPGSKNRNTIIDYMDEDGELPTDRPPPQDVPTVKPGHLKK